MVLETCKADLVPEPVRGARAGRFLLSSLFALLLAVANLRGATAQAKPAVAAADETPHFEVAAIKPGKTDSQGQNWNSSADRILIGNYTLRRLIRSAYGLKSDLQILGGPDWLDKQAFDINAKIDDAEVAKMAKMDRVARQRERNQMVQSLLAERFMFKAHLDHKTMPVYALVVAKSGAKLTPASPETAAKGSNSSSNNGRMTATALSMDLFAEDLQYQTETGGRMVLNHTGLAGEYDFKLDWAEDNGNSTPADPALPDLFTALQEQLGLKLQPEKGSVEVVVIESASKPTFD
jgi:uncharacterized protein (TIGR03435 family)